MLEKKQVCDLCGMEGGIRKLVEEVPNKASLLGAIGIEESMHTVLCGRCGWMFKPEILTSSDLSNMYEQVGGVNTTRAGLEERNALRSAELWSWLEGNCKSSKTVLNVLDVGGGGGHVSAKIADSGHNVEILDIVDVKPIHQSMKFVRGTLSNLGSGCKYDLILMSHILEHVWSPSEMLMAACEKLKDGGYVYVEVPFELYTPLIRKKLGDPCHVGYFTVKTLEQFLIKSGFKCVKIERHLGRYNDRRVMVIRAVAEKVGGEIEVISPEKKNVTFFLLREICNIKQMWILGRYLIYRLIRKINWSSKGNA